MIFPHIFRNVSAGSCRKDQQSVDDQYSNPLDGQHNHQSDKYGKQILNQPDAKLLTLCQRPVKADRLQSVIAENPKYDRRYKYKQKINNLFPCNTQNVAHQQTGVLAEIAASG